MKSVPNGRYTKEFREEAVKLITEGRLSVPEGRPISVPVRHTVRNDYRKN